MQARKKHKRVAFLMPAGTVVDHDTVRAYHYNDARRMLDADLNIGDTFVFEASLKLVDFEEALFFGPGITDVDRAAQEINTCDVAILRGSNYVHGGMQWGNLDKAVEKSCIPVVAFGIGAQAPRYEHVPISDETLRFLKVIAERSKSIGCRGQFTANTLASYGIKNSIPIGCPSIFRFNNRDVNIEWKTPAINRISFTIARGLSQAYCDDRARAKDLQLQIIEELNRSSELYLCTQNERAEKIFFFRAYDRIPEARGLMKGSGWDLEKRPWLEELYWRRIFFGCAPTDYDAMARYCDLTMGFRLHGNIIALANNKPAIYITYDSRTRELVEHFKIPSHDIMEQSAFDLAEWAERPIFDEFNANFSFAYDTTRHFLESNEVAHRMSIA